MNANFLSQMIAKKAMEQQDPSPGVSISNVPSLLKQYKTNNDRSVTALVIPSGIGAVNLEHLQNIPGVTIAKGIDKHYVSNDDSFEKFVNTVETIRPTLIIAGSRGTELVTRFIKDYKGAIMILGGVHLSKLFETNPKNKILLVHGSEDVNERIKVVRGLAHKHKAKLVEATTKGHDMSFDNKQTLVNLIQYALQ